MRAPNPTHVEWYERYDDGHGETFRQIADSQIPPKTHQGVSQAVAKVKDWVASGGAISSTTATATATADATVPGRLPDGIYETHPEPVAPSRAKGIRPPTGLTREQQLDIVVERIAFGGLPPTRAYAKAGLAESTGRSRYNDDPEWAAAVDYAIAVKQERAAANLKRMAEEGDNAIASAIYLSRVDAQNWQEKRGLQLEGVVVHIGRTERERALMSNPAAIAAWSAYETALQNASPAELPEHIVGGEVIDEESAL